MLGGSGPPDHRWAGCRHESAESLHLLSVLAACPTQCREWRIYRTILAGQRQTVRRMMSQLRKTPQFPISCLPSQVLRITMALKKSINTEETDSMVLYAFKNPILPSINRGLVVVTLFR